MNNKKGDEIAMKNKTPVMTLTEDGFFCYGEDFIVNYSNEVVLYADENRIYAYRLRKEDFEKSIQTDSKVNMFDNILVNPIKIANNIIEKAQKNGDEEEIRKKAKYEYRRKKAPNVTESEYIKTKIIESYIYQFETKKLFRNLYSKSELESDRYIKHDYTAETLKGKVHYYEVKSHLYCSFNEYK